MSTQHVNIYAPSLNTSDTSFCSKTDILLLYSFQLQKALYQFMLNLLSSSTTENVIRRLQAKMKIAAFRLRHRKHLPFKKVKFRQALNHTHCSGSQGACNTQPKSPHTNPERGSFTCLVLLIKQKSGCCMGQERGEAIPCLGDPQHLRIHHCPFKSTTIYEAPE